MALGRGWACCSPSSARCSTPRSSGTTGSSRGLADRVAHRRGHRPSARHLGADDRDAAVGGALPCGRRGGGDPGRHERVLHLRQRRPRPAPWPRWASRCCSARSPSPAASWPSASSRRSSRAARSPGRCRTCSICLLAGRRRAAGRARRSTPRLVLRPSGIHGDPGRRARRPDGAPDRRRGHAGRDLAAQRLRRPGRVGDGLRAGQQPAHHRGRPGRRLGLPALDPDVQGDEPLVRQRAVRGLRRARPRRPPGARRGRRDEGDHRRRTPRSGWPTPAWSSWCRATAWRWRRRSTPCAS